MARANPSDGTGAGWNGSETPAEAPKAEFWQKATAPKPPAKPPMKRWKKLAIFGGGGLLLVFLVLVLAAPLIAGSVVPGIVASAAADSIKGPVDIGRASFSWTGRQTIGPITLLDPTKPAGTNQVGSVTIEIDRGLLGLVSAGLSDAPDLGEIRVSGSARIVKYTDGTTNLDRALAPSRPPPPPRDSTRPPRLARGTRALVLLDGIDLTYADEAAPQAGAAIKNLKGEASIAPDTAGTSARVKLSARAAGAPGAAEGTLKVDLKAEQIAGDDGVVRPEKARIDATIEIAALPTSLADALAGMHGRLQESLGPTLGASLVAKGTLKSATASVRVNSDGARVEGDVQVADSVLTTVSPLVATISDGAVRALSGLDHAAPTGTTTITKVPSVSVSVDALRLRLPSGSTPLDLSGASARVVLKTTETAGTLRLREGDAPSQFKVSPIEATLATDDLAGTVKVVASGQATIGTQPAGTLSADIVGTNVLAFTRPAGQGTPPSLQGTVSLKGVATPIAQPFVAGAGLDLARDVGPTLDAELRLATAPSGAGLAGAPPLSAELAIASAKLNARGGFELKDSALRTATGPFTLNADAVGGLLARFVDPQSGMSVAPGGKLTVSISELVVPFKDGDPSRAQLDRAGAKVQAALQGLSIKPTHAAGSSLEVSTLSLGMVASPGASPKVDLNGAMAYAAKPFTLAGSMEIPGAYSFKPDGTPLVTPVAARPSGTIELKGVPTALAAMFTGTPATSPRPAGPPPSPTAPVPPLDMGRFLGDAIGPVIDVKLASAPAKGADAVDLTFSARAERLVADGLVGISDRAIDVKRAAIDATVAPSTLDTVLATYAPDLTPRPRLAGTSKLSIGIDPVSIPVSRDKDGAPRLDLARAGNGVVKATLPQPTLLQSMVLRAQDGTATDLGQLGVEGFEFTARLPLAAFDPATTTGQRFEVAMAGRALDGPGSVLMKLSGNVVGEIDARGVRTADTNFRLTELRVASVDRLLAKPGFLTGAVGDLASLTLDARSRQAQDAPGLATELEVGLQSPRVKMAEPLRLSVLPDRVRSDRAVRIAWTMEPAWANRYVLAPAPGTTDKPATLAAPFNVDVSVSKFSVSTGQGRGPLVPSVFELGATTALSAIELAMPDGAVVRLAGTQVSLNSAPPAPGTPGAAVAFDVKINEVSARQPGAAPSPAKGMTLSGRVDGLSDGAGNLSPATTLVTATGEIPTLPTSLIAALSPRHRWLVDLLGPTASAHVRADRFGSSGGTLDLTAGSERARASVRGAVAGNVFATTEPFKASISEVTKELVQRFVKRMPLIGTVEKRPTDEPALITASGMTVPLNDDMSQLNGEIVIDPGVARFTSGDTFGKLLKAFNQKAEANVGERIQPLNVHINSGVATYDRWTIPIGPNKVSTVGTVDLVNETLDIVTYVPLGALSDDVAGLFQAQAAAQRLLGFVGLDNTLMVPLRSTGPFNNVKTEPHMDLFIKETLSNLRPDRVIERAIDNIFKPQDSPNGGGN